MRSRYAAYALGDADYIMATTAADSPHREPDAEAWRDSLQQFSAQMRFAGLTILDAPEPGPSEAFVTFRAELYAGSRDASFTERSRFVRESGRWVYDRGV